MYLAGITLAIGGQLQAIASKKLEMRAVSMRCFVASRLVGFIPLRLQSKSLTYSAASSC
jgi:hypothetical protein